MNKLTNMFKKKDGTPAQNDAPNESDATQDGKGKGNKMPPSRLVLIVAVVLGGGYMVMDMIGSGDNGSYDSYQPIEEALPPSDEEISLDKAQHRALAEKAQAQALSEQQKAARAALAQADAQTVKKAEKVQAASDVLHLNRNASHRLDMVHKVAAQKMRGQYLKARLEADKTAHELSALNKKPAKKSLTLIDSRVKGNAANRANLELIKVRSIVGQDLGITAWVEIKDQLIPVQLGSHIGNIVVMKLTDNAVTFEAGDVEMTKWISTNVPKVAKKKEKGGKGEVTY